jgi:hypothetical protein
MSDARRAALSALIDHAPLFPPASLSVPDALDEDRRARTDEHAWLLARLVWPSSRLDELEGEDRALSVLLDGPYAGDLRAEAVETRWEAGLDGLAGEAYVELPLGDGLEEKVAALAERGLRAKVRCGGAEVPSAASLGRFLAVCRDAGVPFKATAGLHHPLRCVKPLTYEPDAPTGTMHGFLNVFLAAGFEGDEEEVLRETSPAAFRFSDEGISWRDRTLSLDDLRALRRFAISFGSCSFEEPVADLRELGLL